MAQPIKVAPNLLMTSTMPVRDEYASILKEMAERTGHDPEAVLDAILHYHLIVAPKIIVASMDARVRRAPVQQEGGLDVRF